MFLLVWCEVRCHINVPQAQSPIKLDNNTNERLPLSVGRGALLRAEPRVSREDGRARQFAAPPPRSALSDGGVDSEQEATGLIGKHVPVTCVSPGRA